MPHAPHTTAEYWDTYMPHRGEVEQPAPVVERFEWTQYPGHGPGAEVPGRPGRALELGPAEGKETVFLARRGLDVIGVDLSPVQVERAARWWRAESRATFVCADVRDSIRWWRTRGCGRGWTSRRSTRSRAVSSPSRRARWRGGR
jgi:hypothetical protein